MARLLALTALLLVPTLAFGDPAPGAEAITLEAVKAGIGHLASDALEGRGSGEEGGRKAGDWLAAECKKLGLQPGGDEGTFFQKFTAQRKNMRNVIATLPGRESGEMIVVSGGDPLNLAGIITPGERVAALPSNRVLYRDGVPIAVKEGQRRRLLSETVETRERRTIEAMLTTGRLVH